MMRSFLQQMFRAALPAVLLAVALPALADDEVIANLGAQPVKASEIKDMMPSLTPAQRQQVARDPRVVTQLVRGAIGRKVVLDEAQKQNWEKKPEVAAQIERARNEIFSSPRSSNPRACRRPPIRARTRFAKPMRRARRNS